MQPLKKFPKKTKIKPEMGSNRRKKLNPPLKKIKNKNEMKTQTITKGGWRRGKPAEPVPVDVGFS